MSGLFGRRKWWNPPTDKNEVTVALKRVGLAHRAKDPLTILSKGQARRVLIARILVRGPKLLIMDEPMAEIGQVSREKFAQIVSEPKDVTTTIFVILHESGEFGSLLDRELHIGSRHISYDGAPHALDSREQYVGEGEHHHVYPTALTGPAFVDDVLKGAQ